MATFNVEKFWSTKGKSPKSVVAIPVEGGFKMKLEGNCDGKAASIAKLAAAQFGEVKVARTKVVDESGITTTNSREFSPKDLSNFVTGCAEVLLEEQKDQPAKKDAA